MKTTKAKLKKLLAKQQHELKVAGEELVFVIDDIVDHLKSIRKNIKSNNTDRPKDNVYPPTDLAFLIEDIAHYSKRADLINALTDILDPPEF